MSTTLPHQVRELVHEVLRIRSPDKLTSAELAEEINKIHVLDFWLSSSRVSNIMRADRSSELKISKAEKAYDNRSRVRFYSWESLPPISHGESNQALETSN